MTDTINTSDNTSVTQWKKTDWKEDWDKAAWDKSSWDKESWDEYKKTGEYRKAVAADFKMKTVESGAPCTDECASGSADPTALAKARAHRGRPLKILCLHGGAMNAEGFEAMLANLTVEFGPLVEFVFAQASHADPRHAAPGEFLWMGDAEKQGPDTVGWWDDSLAYLRDFVAAHGPFDGLLGYSMGCASAFALLAQLPPDTFRFAVLCCGYVPTNQPAVMEALEARRPIETPTLHVQGRTDPFTTMGLCDALLEYFASDAVELCKHPGGHSHPYDERHVNQMASFLLRFAAATPDEAPTPD